MKPKLLAILLLCAGSSGTLQSSATNLIVVNVVGARSDNGVLRCSLYASAVGFPNKPEAARSRISAPLQRGQGVCRFDASGPGRYAVSVFHDQNNNGKLDTNFLGIPKEGVGASNGATGHFGPPKFGDAAFDFSGDKLELIVHLHYL